MCFAAIEPGRPAFPNFFSQGNLAFLSGNIRHATNLAIVPLTFALSHGETRLRVVRMRDVKRLEALILGNRSWLRPWEATSPESPTSFDIKSMVRGLLKALDKSEGMPFVIEVDGEIVGQLNVSNMLYGSVSSATIGYWVAPEVAGRGVTPTAVALVTDYLFKNVGLHRVEIDIRPENAASLRVVEKLGFRFEGLKERFIHINGAWRDHYVFALTSEEVPGGILNRWQHKKVPKIDYPWHSLKRKKNEHTAFNE
jgi:ribosomal-protein-alanine N-acetyltransferase